MFYPLEDIKYKHYSSLASTNQKLYQLSEADAPSWTVVTCDVQSKGKGYGENVWVSEPYKNAHFSFVIRHPFDLSTETPYLNMWISTQLVAYLSEWQINAKVKWPNDIILNNKKIAGILIENKIIGTKTKFSIIGLGINLKQKNFPNLPNATSIQKEFPEIRLDVQGFIKDLMEHFHKNYYYIQEYMYDEILIGYNKMLFRKDKVSVFQWNGKTYNGMIHRVLPNGNVHIELEEVGLREFRFKEIKLLF